LTHHFLTPFYVLLLEFGLSRAEPGATLSDVATLLMVVFLLNIIFSHPLVTVKVDREMFILIATKITFTEADNGTYMNK
jgi:hypothetical protein